MRHQLVASISCSPLLIPLRRLAESAASLPGKACSACRADDGPLRFQVLLAVPDDVDDVTAAQFYINPLTAMGIVEVRRRC